jgi:hypothetical protein
MLSGKRVRLAEETLCIRKPGGKYHAHRAGWLRAECGESGPTPSDSRLVDVK